MVILDILPLEVVEELMTHQYLVDQPQAVEEQEVEA